MGDRGGRFDQVEVELQRAKKRGSDESRMDRRANVMPKSRERQLRGASSATDRLLRLDDAYRAPSLSERDRGGKAIRPRADDNGV
jgi:hypothetical protein